MMTDKPIANVVSEIKRVLASAVDKGAIGYKIPIEMDSKLRNDVTMFSGFKTAQELHQAGLSLYSNGTLKSFDSFKQDVLKINSQYNVNYLNAEYEFAAASAQMAGKWAEFAADGDNFNLQYRTANDGNVRQEHAILDGITLPVSDPFWNSYFPPNGWRCRCSVVQVRKGKYETSDPDNAMKAGNMATNTPKKALFRFNTGKKELIFPEKHPYYKVNDNTRKEVMKAVIKTERKEIRDFARQNLIGKTTVKINEIKYPIEFTGKGIAEALNQPHKYLREKNAIIKYIKQMIKQGEYVRFDKDIKGNIMIKGYHYIKIKINGEESFIVIREHSDKKATFYTITDKIK